MSLETKINNLRIEYDQKEIVERNLEIDKMQRKISELENRRENMKNNKLKEPQLPKSIEKEIKELQNQKIKIEKALIELEKMMKASNYFQEFISKHQIENFEIFRNSNNFSHIEKLLKKKHEVVK